MVPVIVKALHPIRSRYGNVLYIFTAMFPAAIVLCLLNFRWTACLILLALWLLVLLSHKRMLSRLRELQADMRHAIQPRKKSMLQDILLGLDNRALGDPPAAGLCGISFPFDSFAVCMLQIDDYRKIKKRYSSRDVALFKYCIANIAEETASRHYKCGIVEEQGDRVVLIMNAGMENLDPESLESLIREMQAHIRNLTKMTVTVSLGSVCESSAGIRRSYEQAKQASRYRLIYGKSAIIRYPDTIRPDDKDNLYPYAAEKLLTDSLKLGDMQKVTQLTDEFIGSLRGLDYSEIMLSLIQLFVMTIRTAKGMINDFNEELKTKDTDFHHVLYELDTLEEIREWYLELCGNVVKVRDEKSNKKNEELIKKVTQFIADHYHDDQLSIDTLAGIVGLSPNYLRKVFKSETNQTIANFITEIRFQKAKELLLTTDYPANKIGELIGIPNNGYFYIAFKKHFGKTPNQFRTGQKQEKGQEPPL